jgi:hypothetical protein
MPQNWKPFTHLHDHTVNHTYPVTVTTDIYSFKVVVITTLTYLSQDTWVQNTYVVGSVTKFHSIVPTEGSDK